MCDTLVDYSQVKNLKMLRVLASQSCYPKLPLGYVGKLIHLRCLRLRGQSINLPYSLGNLKYLETLDLSDSDVGKIPNVLWKLKRLKYLYLPDLQERWEPLKYPDFLDLQERLERLKYLCLRNLWWPPQCCKLRLSEQLEILESFDNVFCYPKDLCKMLNLRSFKANVYKNLEDLEHIINHISNLDCLCISSLTINDFDFGSNRGLDVLSRVLFSRKIHELVIDDGICKKLPDYQSHMFPDPAGLTQLKLRYTRIKEDPMGTLEKLPNLRILEVGSFSFLGQKMTCHSGGFPELKHLRLDYLIYLKRWVVKEGAMPKLSSLWIGECEELEMIPDGLRYVTTLKEVSLVDMPEEFNNRIRGVNGQQGEDYDKIRKVASVKILSY
nr:probable disease resistance protein At1g58602 [Coffea arabica]